MHSSLRLSAGFAVLVFALQTPAFGDEAKSSTAAETSEADALAIFERRILPIMQSRKPSSCTECHLSGVELKDYIRPDQAKTFASLRDRGLIDVKRPEESKILKFISRRSDGTSLITRKVRDQEHAAFKAWIVAASRNPDLLKAEPGDDAVGARLPVEVIRHGRKDRVLESFVDNVWSEVMRCAACHAPDRNQKQVKRHGEQMSWIRLKNPRATLEYMVDAGLIDVDSPADSLLITKPTLQVEHKGGKKIEIGDRTYKQFRRFFEDYAATVNGKYTKASELPEQRDEVSTVTRMWFKITNVPFEYDQKLLRVDVFRREGDGWSKQRWATAERAVFGKKHLWQDHLSVTSPRDAKRAERIRTQDVDMRLPAGDYLARIYIDREGRLKEDYRASLGEKDLVGEVRFSSKWALGYQQMTEIRFPSERDVRD